MVSLALEPVEFPAFPALQSFALGHTKEYWILVGGRTDGIHRRQPFAAFKPVDNNNYIFLVHQLSKQVTKISLADLEPAVAEQLASVNINSLQLGEWLLLIGGYSYSQLAGDHITHPRITLIHLPELIRRQQAGLSIRAAFQSWTDDSLANTGGQLARLGDTIYLAGGQRFTGRYNPHDGPSFTQQYADAIKRFKLKQATNGQWELSWLSSWIDKEELHRRDYNLLPRQFFNGQTGFTLYSGVFQRNADLPFLHSVWVSPNGIQPYLAFKQRLNHYHSGKVGVYSNKAQTQVDFFFGGMAQFQLNQAGELVEDADVPSVSTIGAVAYVRDSLPQEWEVGHLPALEGSGAEFVPHANVAVLPNGLIDWDKCLGERVLIGHLVGGIQSQSPHVFFGPNTKTSTASNKLYAVYAIRLGQTFAGRKVPVK